MTFDPSETRRRTTPRRKIESLAVVCCFFNPSQYKTNIKNYWRFRKHMKDSGVDVFTIELNFNDDVPEIQDAHMHVRGSEDNLLWQKERLLNMLLPIVPDTYDAIGWFDTDVLFLNHNWVRETFKRLRTRAVLQPFTQPYTLFPNGTISTMKNSCCWAYHHDKQHSGNFSKYHPGFAWVARADWLKKYKLLDTAVTGGGDTLMARAFLDRVITMEKRLHPEWLAEADRWKQSLADDVNGSVTYVDGVLLHLYHGSRADRKYTERWKWLIDNSFNPAVDLEDDQSNGLLRWSESAIANKPEMIQLTKSYFDSRKEDDVKQLSFQY